MTETPQDVTSEQAQHLIATQLPDLAGLPLRWVGATGTDNVLYRIGLRFVARFPRFAQSEA
ncbi:MAG: hypothetical protein ACOH2H_23700 [Cypionkella sp.]